MTAQNPDFDVTVRLRNNHLLAWREGLRLTGPQAAELVGISYGSWWELESLRASPINLKTGKLRPAALKVSEAIGSSPDELWPEAVISVRQSVVHRKMDGPEALELADAVGDRMHLLPSPEEYAELSLARRRLNIAMTDKLTPRERLVLTMRWGLDGQGDRDQKDVAAALNVSSPRAYQIEQRAIRKLRHSTIKLRVHARALYETEEIT